MTDAAVERPAWLTPEVEKFCATPFPGTRWALMEVYEVGEALLNFIATTETLGHASPGNTLDYAPSALTGHLATDLVADFVAWTSGRQTIRPGAEDRVRSEITDSGWQRHALSGSYDRLTSSEAVS